MHYTVKNGSRLLEFDGDLLASSTSKRPGAFRWVEFNLYLTNGGSYVLERIGQTLIFHTVDCEVVERNKLKYSPEDRLTKESVPCEICDPFDDDDIILERGRFFAVVSENPETIVKALQKTDRDGSRYQTYVTQRLIEEACTVDKRLERAYRVEYIA